MASDAEDRDAIRDLLARYCLYIDTGAVDEWVEVFTDDGRFEADGDPVVGRDALRAFGSGLNSGSMHRMVTNEVIEIDGDTAECRSSILITADRSTVMTGRVHDQLRRIDGHWHIAHRRFTPDGR
jgi:uncharacterized protein (TIGR02246 family)